MIKIKNKKYNHIIVEKNKYDFWKLNNFFNCDIKSKKKPFTIVMPPPNITGKLHLGHAWDTVLQDSIIRYKKLNGYDTLYLPGMDHAGIATQLKIEEKLKLEKKILIDKEEIGKEKFIDEILKWKEKFSFLIKEQWKKIGLSLDFSKECFTLDENFSNAVKKVFIYLYNKKLIYHGYKMVLLDTYQKTVLSNIEVNYKKIKNKLYYFKYFLENNNNDYIPIATTRPETIFVDQCILVNPNDNRYKKYWNKNVINPLNNKKIPILFDEYVKINLGTGAMKCTPAHDFNDFDIGLRHNLKNIACINIDGTMNHNAKDFEGQDRFLARKNIVNKLIKNNFLLKIEEKNSIIGFSQRSNTIVEPYLSKQWFLKTKSLANNIIKFQNSSEKIFFYPKKFNKTLINWLKNIQDWCISRQLWWGHQIPVWYNKKNNKKYVGINHIKDIIDIENWYQESDVLDTWFSSSLWPFVALGWGWEKKLFNRYFPVDILVTGYDIIFFWVSRMIFQSLEFTNKKPFKEILIHGLIRDENNFKMSKSLNNGIDPNLIIEEYGADTLRIFLISNSAPGNDLKFSKEKLNNSWNFINKIWNASRFVLMNLCDNFEPIKKFDNYFLFIINNNNFFENYINYWIIIELFKIIKLVKLNMKKYNFMLVINLIKDFFWNKYCSWYLEFVKINLNEKNEFIKDFTKQTMFYVLKEIIIVLHPFIPFVTEEIYQLFNLKKSIMLENYFNYNFKCNKKVYFFKYLIKIIISIREFRQQKKIKKQINLKFKLFFLKNNIFYLFKKYLNTINKYILKFVNSNIIEIFFSKEINLKNNNFISLDFCTLEIILDDINFFEIKNKINYNNNNNLLKIFLNLEKELLRSEKILNNKDFLNKACLKKINEEKEKYKKYISQYEEIKKILKK